MLVGELYSKKKANFVPHGLVGLCLNPTLNMINKRQTHKTMQFYTYLQETKR